MPQIPENIMILNIFAILVGFILLAWSSDKFILGASSIAKIFGVPPLIIGITIVGFGTSAPEILVSVMAALQDNPSLAIGNAIGSNIANIALVLGVSAVIIPIIVKRTILIKEMSLLFAVMIMALLLIVDKQLSQINAIILLVSQVAILAWMVRNGKKGSVLPIENELSNTPPPSTLKASLLLLGGLCILLASSKILVWGAVNVAKSFGVSDLVIGLTIIALGTSLPELAACVAAVRKKHDDIAIGNILGSNIFNILSVLGVAALIAPTDVDPNVLYRDFPTMLGLTILLLIFSFSRGKEGTLSRLKGIIFIIIYAVYQAALFALNG